MKLNLKKSVSLKLKATKKSPCSSKGKKLMKRKKKFLGIKSQLKQIKWVFNYSIRTVFIIKNVNFYHVNYFIYWCYINQLLKLITCN